jgi:tRNA-2-methylthio-N6-dimethylallyladenosine synthase
MQSGADRILKMMRRGYGVRDYRSAIDRLREAVPGLAVTTDVIVGYPSETTDEFEMTRRVMEEIGFDNAFIFKYSPRPDTAAEQVTDDVSDEEKIRRNQVLLMDQNVRGQRINDSLVSQDLEVLVEGTSPRNSSRWHGRSRTNKIVVFEPRDEVRRGELIEAHIVKAMPQTLRGEIGGEHGTHA